MYSWGPFGRTDILKEIFVALNFAAINHFHPLVLYKFFLFLHYFEIVFAFPYSTVVDQNTFSVHFVHLNY